MVSRMNSKYLISVIIPAYNSEKTLERAINSIGNVDGLEIIIVENGSIDNTTNIAENLEKKDKRVRVYHSNKGVSNARNCGIEKANGKWITFLDSDDSYRAGALEIMTRYAAESAELISFGHYNGNNKISQCKNTIICDSSDCISVKARMIERPNVYMLSVAKLFLREVIVENGIRFSEKLSLAEDSDFVINYMRYINRIIISPRCIYNYLVNNTSTMNTYDRQIIKKYLYSLQLTKTRIKDQPIEIKEAYDKYVLHHLNFMMVRGPFSASCKSSLFNKVIVLKRTCKIEIIDKAIRSLQIRDITNFRLIPLLFIKFKMKMIACSIFWLRGKGTNVD